MSYRTYLNSEMWLQKRRAVIERSRNGLPEDKAPYGICERCRYIPKRKGVMQVHHKRYTVRGEEDLSDLILLCSDCHRAEHENDAKFIKKHSKKKEGKKMSRNEVTFKVLKEIGTLKENGTVKKQLNIVSWNGEGAVCDLRGWSFADGERKPLKGLTLTATEAKILRDLLNSIEFASEESNANETETEVEEGKENPFEQLGILGY